MRASTSKIEFEVAVELTTTVPLDSSIARSIDKASKVSLMLHMTLAIGVLERQVGENEQKEDLQ